MPWQFWTSVTKVKVLPFIADAPFAPAPTVDGSISSGEYTDGDSLQFTQGGATTKVYYKVDGTNFYAAFDFPTMAATSEARIYFDTLHDGALTPQTDDYRFAHAINSSTSESQGNGTGWSANTPTGWTSSSSTGASGWQAEFCVSYAKLGISPGASDTLGISFWHAGTGAGDHRWPTGADNLVPCSWGDVLSSDLFVPVELETFDAKAQ